MGEAAAGQGCVLFGPTGLQGFCLVPENKTVDGLSMGKRCSDLHFQLMATSDL